MESAPQAQLRRTIFLGEFEVVDVRPTTIAIHLGRNVVIYVEARAESYTVKVGDKVPLFSEFPLCPRSTN